MARLLVGNIVEPSVVWMDNESVRSLGDLDGHSIYGALIRVWGPQFSCRVLDMA